ncbi:hypothetical protein [Phycicoccus flavus]|nr:hypothetical protein [Phycicoccus flavus]
MRSAPGGSATVAAMCKGRVAYDQSAGVPVAGARDIPEEKV